MEHGDHIAVANKFMEQGYYIAVANNVTTPRIYPTMMSASTLWGCMG
jgi:hypothetical protein